MKVINRDIHSIIQFLDKVKLQGRKSLGRSKLKEVIASQNEALAQEQTDVIEEFDGWIDKESGTYKTDLPEMNKALSDLFSVETELAYDSPFRSDFEDAIEEYVGELEGSDADAYALLYEQLITNKGEK